MSAHCLEVKTGGCIQGPEAHLVKTFVSQLWNAVEADEADEANTHCKFSTVKYHRLPLVLAS